MHKGLGYGIQAVLHIYKIHEKLRFHEIIYTNTKMSIFGLINKCHYHRKNNYLLLREKYARKSVN